MNQAVQALSHGISKHLRDPDKYLYGLSILANSGMVSDQQLNDHLTYFNENAGRRTSVLRLMKMDDEKKAYWKENEVKIIDLIAKNDMMKKWRSEISKKAGIPLQPGTGEFSDLAEIIYVAMNIVWNFTLEDFGTYSAVNRFMKRLNKPDLKYALDFAADRLLMPKIFASAAYDNDAYDNLRTIAAKIIGVFMVEEYYLGPRTFDKNRLDGFPSSCKESEAAVRAYFTQWNLLFRPQNVVKDKELFMKMKAVFNS
ncbi:MAG: hypothetical protein HUJ54_09825 [Erysipelotrichaceae bacterium]|nr:hypothetical protein [Erysipelotrichaceae bacterium]